MNIYEETKMIMRKYGLNFKKKFGQNFLINEEILNKMIEKSGITNDDIVLEIGPGIGTLTSKILEKNAEVISVEIDEELIKPLKDRFFMYENYTLINGDILKIDLKEELHNILAKKHKEGRKIKVLANIPYYITTDIITVLIENLEIFESINIMIQKEVAERICAKTGEKQSSALTYFIDYYLDFKWQIEVNKGNFLPAPKVDSAIVGFDIRKEDKYKLSETEKDIYFKLVKAGFLHRRKTFLNAIKISGMQFDMKKIESILNELGLDLRVRAESISAEKFCEIAKKYTV